MECFKILLAVSCLCYNAVSGFQYEENPYCVDCADKSDYYNRDCICRTYTFAFGVFFPIVYCDEDTYEPVGPTVDVVRKVCEIANRDCDFALVERDLCWDGKVSQVLNGKWYDVCVPFSDQDGHPRKKKYAFPKHGLLPLGNYIIVARPGANVTEAMLRDPTNELKIAFLDNPSFITKSAIDLFYEAGYFIKPHNLVAIESDTPEEGFGILNGMLNEACDKEDNGGTVDIFIYTSFNIPKRNESDDYTFVTEINADNGIASLMFRRDDRCLMSWWDQAYETLICSDGYLDFCQGINAAGGNRYNVCQNQSICN